jgi:glyoxylase-like metal-dependent hydrolase (beta-lactamase superfamily II)
MTDSSALHLWQVRYARRTLKMSYAFHNFEQYGLPDEDLEMDYSFWVIRAGNDVILFDTGYPLHERNTHDEVHVISPPEGLRLLGIEPSDVTMVIASHFHYDHIGYVGLFTNATIVAGAAEREYWFGLWDSGQLEGTLASKHHLAAIQVAEAEGRLVLVEQETEVYPGVTVYPVSGHSPGELLTVAQTAAGSFLLASDASHFYEQFEQDWPFFAFTNLDEMKAGFAFIRNLAAATNSVVIPGHDGRTRLRFPPAEGAAADVAVQLA